MWKFFPETVEFESREDSTDGNGSRSVSGPPCGSYGGGVRAFCSGDAVYESGWNGRCDCIPGVDWKAGGREDRFFDADGTEVAELSLGGMDGE